MQQEAYGDGAMKFSIEKEALIAGLQQVMNVVGTRLTMPILSNVLLEATPERLVLSTTNLDIGMRCLVKADVSEPGSTTLPVKKLASIIKALAAKTVTFNAEDNEQVHISGGGSRFRILGLPADDFPRLPQLEVEQKVTLQQMQFSKMLKSISYAQSRDENRYLLNGMYWLVENEKLHFIATDGRRLAMIANDVPGCPLQRSVIVPAKTVIELERTLGIGENAQIMMTDKQIAFLFDVAGEGSITDSIYVVSKIVEGNYPNYKQVIPSTLDHHIRIDREQLLSVIQRIALVADEKNYAVKLAFSKNSLEISAQSQAYGEAREVLPIAYEDEDVAMGFNPQFLCDPLKVLTSDEIAFEFKNEMSPGVIRTNDDFKCVIMPLRIN